VDVCPYAQGFYLRLPGAIEKILPLEKWDEETIRQVALENEICPFEFSLSLAEVADVVVGDYNYAFDPSAHIQRVFDERRDMTLLIDESHNLLSRVRDMLSATVDTKDLRALKKAYPKRSHPMSKALTEAIKAILAFETMETTPVADSFNRLMDRLLDEMGQGLAGDMHFEIYMALKMFLRSIGEETHAYILEGTKAQKRLTAFCLSVSEHIHGVTAGLRGIVFFSATLSPLQDMKILFGGDEEDAIFQMPSPFPPKNFFIKRVRANTRYAARAETAAFVAENIRTLFLSKEGKYIAFFPSFKYMELVSEELSDLPLIIQTTGMDEAAREAFLAHYHEGDEAVLGLCVMGGIFSEGIDLPGDKLLGVMLVGVGLPQVNIFQETLRDYYEQRFNEGFKYAYQIPGMHKILQAAGRVIRSETDKGACLLIDDRYEQRAYEKLCPPHWRYQSGEIGAGLNAFWKDAT
jgi:Rad3-related DNA helicases